MPSECPTSSTGAVASASSASIHSSGDAPTLAERPQASLLARRQAETALAVTNLRHRTVSLKDETVRRFLMLVDGTRTLDELVIDLNAVLEPNGNGARPSVPREVVEKNLGLLAKLGLLAASAVPQ